MNGILGFTDLLKESNLTAAEKEKFIGVIERSGNRLLNTVNDLIDFSKIEAGQMKVSVSSVDINELTEQLYTFFHIEAEQKGLQLILNSTAAIPQIRLRSDWEKMYSVLTNLIKNAIKYSQKGKIEFGYQPSGTDLLFFVKDTGLGIDQDKLEVIFERFIRSNDEEFFSEGSGLGLSIAKAYVEMLGGKIWVESEKGKGSQFYFTIPFHVAKPEKQQQETETAAAPASLANKLKILIVEDDEAADELLALLTKDISKEVIHTRSGAKAVELCRMHPDFDLILMDINLPELNGYEATKQIRKFNKDVVIIAQTAYALTGDQAKSIEAGCNAYLSKPINKSALMSLIRQFTEK